MKKPPAPRFGIGEWYGHLLAGLSREERHRLSEAHREGGRKIPCPFKPEVSGVPQPCTKPGGVCSLKLYEAGELEAGIPVEGSGGSLRTLCPYRFQEDRKVERWIAETLLGTDSPLSVTEVGFLRSEQPVGREVNETGDPEEFENVGRIDSVLMHPDLEPLCWCAVEAQAVYFSGSEMEIELASASSYEGCGAPFPKKTRRPDYRSSGPKRLMPQLQIKVPTLRRWGKKMAVVVDEAFFSALGAMDDVNDPSNADIGWFVVRFKEDGARAELEPGFVRFTTLERAVEGLTAGRPVTLPEFEARVKAKLDERRRSREKALRKPAKRDLG